jgi:pimeloyl-ACP methyl ester carboxylesterase
MRTMCIEAGLATYERQMEALLARPDGTKALGLVRVPTLLGVGRQDEWSPLAQHEEIAARLPDARLVVFEDSGHMAPVEAADQVNRALRQWLAA